MPRPTFTDVAGIAILVVESVLQLQSKQRYSDEVNSISSERVSMPRPTFTQQNHSGCCILLVRHPPSSWHFDANVRVALTMIHTLQNVNQNVPGLWEHAATKRIIGADRVPTGEAEVGDTTQIPNFDP